MFDDDDSDTMGEEEDAHTFEGMIEEGTRDAKPDVAPTDNQESSRAMAALNKIQKFDGEPSKRYSWKGQFRDLMEVFRVENDMRMGQIGRTRLGDIPRFYVEGKGDIKMMGWTQIEQYLDERYGKVTPDRLFDVMDITQEASQSMDKFVMKIETAYQGVCMGEDMMNRKYLREKQIVIKLLKEKPKTFTQAVDMARGMEDIYKRVESVQEKKDDKKEGLHAEAIEDAVQSKSKKTLEVKIEEISEKLDKMTLEKATATDPKAKEVLDRKEAMKDQSDRGRGGYRGRGSGDTSRLRCFHCNKVGHIKSSCWALQGRGGGRGGDGNRGGCGGYQGRGRGQGNYNNNSDYVEAEQCYDQYHDNDGYWESQQEATTSWMNPGQAQQGGRGTGRKNPVPNKKFIPANNQPKSSVMVTEVADDQEVGEVEQKEQLELPQSTEGVQSALVQNLEEVAELINERKQPETGRLMPISSSGVTSAGTPEATIPASSMSMKDIAESIWEVAELLPEAEERLPPLPVKVMDVSALDKVQSRQVFCRAAREQRLVAEKFEKRCCTPPQQDIGSMIQMEELEQDEKTMKSRMWMAVEIEGFPFDALVDTGASFSFISLEPARKYFQHVERKAAILRASTTNGQRLSIVAQAKVNIRIGNTVIYHRMYIIKGTGKKVLIGDDILASQNFTIRYPGPWVWLNSERIETKTNSAPVIEEAEEVCCPGETVKSVVIPVRSARFLQAAAPRASEGKVVIVAPSQRYAENNEILIAQTVEVVDDGMVPVWAINTTQEEKEIILFDNIVEIEECEVLSAVPKKKNRGAETSVKKLYTSPDASHPRTKSIKARGSQDAYASKAAAGVSMGRTKEKSTTPHQINGSWVYNEREAQASRRSASTVARSRHASKLEGDIEEIDIIQDEVFVDAAKTWEQVASEWQTTKTLEGKVLVQALKESIRHKTPTEIFGIALKPSVLTVAQRWIYWLALEQLQEIFAKTDYDLGRTGLVKHHIYTGDEMSIKCRPYRVPLALQDAADENVDSMLKTGVIRPSSSLWAAPVVLVKKKDGKIRYCCDFRKLNRVTKQGAYPLPQIEERLDGLNGACIFSIFDLQSGYRQIEVADDAKEKTGFVTPKGHLNL